MTKALTHFKQNRIFEVVEDDKTFPVHPHYTWVDVSVDTKTYDTWDGIQVVKYIQPPLPTPPRTKINIPASAATSFPDLLNDFNDLIAELKAREII